MEPIVNDKKSTLMYISSMLIFGTIGIFRRYIPLPSAFLAFSRGILGGLFLLAVSRLRRISTRQKEGRGEGTGEKESWEKAARGKNIGERITSGKDIGGKAARDQRMFCYLLALIFTGALMGINWILLFEAFNTTTVSIATLCYYMQPTIVILLSPIIFKETLTRKKILCAAAAILGMVLVSGVMEDKGAQSGNIQGILLGLGAAVFYAAVVIMNKKIQGVGAYQKTTIQLFSAGLAMIPYLLWTNGFAAEGLSLKVILLVFFVGIVHTGLAYALYFGSMNGLRVQSIALLSYIDPVSALFFSALFLGERLSLYGIIGAVMIIGSAIVSEIQPRTEEL